MLPHTLCTPEDLKSVLTCQMRVRPDLLWRKTPSHSSRSAHPKLLFWQRHAFHLQLSTSTKAVRWRPCGVPPKSHSFTGDSDDQHNEETIPRPGVERLALEERRSRARGQLPFRREFGTPFEVWSLCLRCFFWVSALTLGRSARLT